MLLTWKQLFLTCAKSPQVRNNCFHVNNMKELFQDTTGMGDPYKCKTGSSCCLRN